MINEGHFLSLLSRPFFCHFSQTGKAKPDFVLFFCFPLRQSVCFQTISRCSAALRQPLGGTTSPLGLRRGAAAAGGAAANRTEAASSNQHSLDHIVRSVGSVLHCVADENKVRGEGDSEVYHGRILAGKKVNVYHNREMESVEVVRNTTLPSQLLRLRSPPLPLLPLLWMPSHCLILLDV